MLHGTTVAQEVQTPQVWPWDGSSREKGRSGTIMQWRQKSFLVGGAVVFDWDILWQMQKVDLDRLVRCQQVTIKQLYCQNTKCLAIIWTRHSSFFYVPHWPPVNFTRLFSKIPKSLEPSKSGVSTASWPFASGCGKPRPFIWYPNVWYRYDPGHYNNKEEGKPLSTCMPQAQVVLLTSNFSGRLWVSFFSKTLSTQSSLPWHLFCTHTKHFLWIAMVQWTIISFSD